MPARHSKPARPSNPARHSKPARQTPGSARRRSMACVEAPINSPPSTSGVRLVRCGLELDFDLCVNDDVLDVPPVSNRFCVVIFPFMSDTLGIQAVLGKHQSAAFMVIWLTMTTAGMRKQAVLQSSTASQGGKSLTPQLPVALTVCQIALMSLLSELVSPRRRVLRPLPSSFPPCLPPFLITKATPSMWLLSS